MLATNVVVVFVALEVCIWLVLLSGMSRGVRGGCAVAIVLLLAAFNATMKFQHFGGGLEPRFRYRNWVLKLLGREILPDERAVDGGSVVAIEPATETDSPQFLGPGGLNHAQASQLDLDWRAHPPREIWRETIGPEAGWSAFAVVGQYAITQEQRADHEDVVCYDLTGKVHWVHSDPGRFSEIMGGVGPRATPTIDRGRVYTLGANGVLNCLNMADGKPAWTRNIVKDHGGVVPQWGYSGSPLVVDDMVVVSPGGPDGHALAAYKLADGSPVWHAGNDEASYATPVLATLSDTRQVIMVYAHGVSGHDPRTGEVLWTFDWPGGFPKVPQPVVVGPTQLFIAAGYGLGCKLLNVKRAEGSWTTEELWSNRQLQSKFANVVHSGDYIYGLDDGARLSCIALATGKTQWRKRMDYRHGQILMLGDKLLVQAELGAVALVGVSPEGFEELARLPAMDDQTWNQPVVAGRHLLVRNHVELVFYELPVK